MKILLNLLAGVALLVWGTHIVRTSILRLYGGDLRRILRQSVSNRFAAFAAGLGVTALIQSSNATAITVASSDTPDRFGRVAGLNFASVVAVPHR